MDYITFSFAPKIQACQAHKELIPWLEHKSLNQHTPRFSDDKLYKIDAYTFHSSTGKAFNLSLYRGNTNENEFSMYLKIDHPIIETLERTHDIIKRFEYNPSTMEPSFDWLDNGDQDYRMEVNDFLQPRIHMARCGLTPATKFKHSTYWNDTGKSTKSLRLYPKDYDQDLDIRNSCRFEPIFRHGLKSFGLTSIPAIIDSDHSTLVEMLKHISLKEIDWLRFRKTFEKSDIKSTFDRVKRNILWKLRDTQINETALYVKQKYDLKLPLIDHEHSDLFRSLLSEGCLRDFLSRSQ